MHPLSLYFIVVVWGEAYVEMLLQVALRSFMSPQNIPGLSSLSQSRFVFATTAADYAKISQSQIFKQLASFIEPVFIELDADADENVYQKATRGFELATQLAAKNKAYAVYLLPDGLVSDGTLTRLEHYAKAGREVVLIPGPRIIKEKFMDYLHTEKLIDDSPLCFKPRELAKIGLAYLHPQFKNYNYTQTPFTKWPHVVTWDVPNQEGLLFRSFHLHPLMVDCTKENPPVFDKQETIDAEFIKKNFFNLNQFFCEEDSDHMILYSLTEEEDRKELGLLWSQQEKFRAIVEMSQSHLVHTLQKIYFYYAYKLHTGELTPEWQAVEHESLALVEKVLTSKYRHRNTLFVKLRALTFKLLPSKIRPFLAQMYWTIKGNISKFRFSFFVTSRTSSKD